MTLTNKQRIAMLSIVIAGVVGSAALVLNKSHSSAHQDEASHDHADESPSQATHGAKQAGAPSAAPEEGFVKLTPEQQKAAGLGFASAGPAKLQSASDFPGEIRFNEDRTAHVVPRLAGVVEAVHADLGQRVKKGQVLAVIASTVLSEQRSELLTAQRRQEAARVTLERERKLWQDKISAEQDYLQAQSVLREADIAVSNALQKLAAVGAAPTATQLNRFEVRAPFDGMVVEKHLALGEAVREDANIFTLSDLSTVWAEFAVAPKDLAVVRVGQKVAVSSTAFAEQAEGQVSYVGALIGEQTRTARARVTLANPQGAWRPGLYVTASVLGTEQPVALAVPLSAVQTVEDKPSVFRVVDGGFRAVPVKTGRTDRHQVEILQGLAAGDRMVMENAFLLKAELGKSSAEHGH
ncbi:efflux RND transporter periplasmic adaptor subunit [Curvibacter sp. HBC28]|uniref:Efflux RND transporter periplasmic adaptor subunit n=1 Tax=Curvibacter microcysteis TaxID=3026419 RepID=A0ABT5MDT0_9BURK|nr:efflux RND transporter periplasmic adaptor subunit [Curvibacter sp. HBC28]MDD0813271.1 efflux RND transporter periplasmic adaptor subunit [Curvibacter sp. HBC28]